LISRAAHAAREFRFGDFPKTVGSSCDRSKPDRVPVAMPQIAMREPSAAADAPAAPALIGTDVSLLAHRPRDPTWSGRA
jgi:hypothetical protein